MYQLVVKIEKLTIDEKFKHHKKLIKIQDSVFTMLSKAYFNKKDVLDKSDPNKVTVIMAEGTKQDMVKKYKKATERGDFKAMIAGFKQTVLRWFGKSPKIVKQPNETPYDYIKRWLLTWAFIDYSIDILHSVGDNNNEKEKVLSEEKEKR